MKEVKVVHARFNDSVEDWILDNMIQDTMKPYFEWKDQTGTDVTFVKVWDGGNDYYPFVLVKAEFKNDVDSALFVTSFPELPTKSLSGPSFS